MRDIFAKNTEIDILTGCSSGDLEDAQGEMAKIRAVLHAVRDVAANPTGLLRSTEQVKRAVASVGLTTAETVRKIPALHVFEGGDCRRA